MLAMSTSAHNTGFLAFSVALVLIAAGAAFSLSNRRKMDRIDNKDEFVAYGSMKNWYNSPRSVFGIIRRFIETARTRLFGTNHLAKKAVEVPKSTVALTKDAPTLDLNVQDTPFPTLDINTIDEDSRTRVVSLTLHMLGVTDTNRFLGVMRPGDLSDLRSHLINVRVLTSNGRRKPNSLMARAQMTNGEFAAIIKELVKDPAYIRLCLKHIDFISVKLSETRSDEDYQPNIGVFTDSIQDFFQARSKYVSELPLPMDA